jgi:hypothetical protein
MHHCATWPLPLPSLQTVLAVYRDLAQGLAYLHACSVVHGDLKPANVLLKVDEGCDLGFVAKLADFGLSRQLEQGATHLSNYAKGTPFYVAPEVVRDKTMSMASDIWSFGIIMWWVAGYRGPAFERVYVCVHLPMQACQAWSVGAAGCGCAAGRAWQREHPGRPALPPSQPCPAFILHRPRPTGPCPAFHAAHTGAWPDRPCTRAPGAFFVLPFCTAGRCTAGGRPSSLTRRAATCPTLKHPASTSLTAPNGPLTRPLH